VAGTHVLTILTDKGPILLTDYFHRDYLSIVEDVVGKDVTKVVSVTSFPFLQARKQGLSRDKHVTCPAPSSIPQSPLLLLLVSGGMKFSLIEIRALLPTTT
jgi:hypothetical protein